MGFPANGKNAKLGKGALFLDFFDPTTGLPTGLQMAGNCSAVAISADTQKADLYSGTEQSSPLIASAVTRVAYNLTATLTEYQMRNLASFLLGEEASRSQTMAASQNLNVMNVVPGRFYDVGYRNITAVSVVRGSDTLTLGSDYTLDAGHGMIGIKAGGPHSVVTGDDIVVTYSRPAVTLQQIRIAKVASPEAKLLFLSDDANAAGAAAKDRLEIWRVNVAPEGELNLVSDDYGTYQLTFAVVDDSANHATDPFGRLERIAAA